MLTSKERRDLEAYWTEERMIRAATLVKVSALIAAFVGLLWIGVAADGTKGVESAIAVTPQDTERPEMVGISAIHARQVFDERQAQGTEDDMVPMGELLGETRYVTAESGEARSLNVGRDVRASR